jgi:hypothetical protein
MIIGISEMQYRALDAEMPHTEKIRHGVRKLEY